MKYKQQLSYLAGLLDGEGCLVIDKTYERKTCIPRLRYNPKLEISNTFRPVLYWCKLLFGGFVIKKHTKAGCKDAWVWALQGVNAIDLVKVLLPYLKIKKEQAYIFIRYEQTFPKSKKRRFCKSIPMTDEAERIREQLRLGLQEAKRYLYWAII